MEHFSMNDFSVMETKTLSDEGVWFHPCDLNGVTLDCEFKVYGPDSIHYNALQAKRRARAMRAIADARDNIKIDPVKARDEALEDMAELLGDWRGVGYDGEELVFSEEEAKTLFRNVPYLAEQVDRLSRDRRNFTKPGLQTSATASGKSSS
jgi:hypothetical protein